MKSRTDSFKARLKWRRRTLEMSQRALGTSAGIGHATIQSLESGDGSPSIKTVEALAQALKVSSAWLAFGAEGDAQALTLDVAEGFDPSAYLDRIAAEVESSRPIDQLAKYLDQRGVRRWLDLLRSQNHEAFVSKMPLPEIARELVTISDGKPVDLVGLGCGTAHQELRLTTLLNSLAIPLRLCLVDISVYLLILAYQQARRTIKDTPVDLAALIADIYELPSYADRLLAASVERLRVYCLFGYTFGNLRQEDDLFVKCLAGAAVRNGDLLLLDVTVALPKPEEEPVLVGQRSSEFLNLMYGFLSAPIHSLIGSSSEVTVEPALESGRIPGSYIINLYGRYKAGIEARRQSLAVVTRYSIASLQDYLKGQHWTVISSHPYDDGHAAVLVCQYKK
jgi:transcriptional regulator with XRE-family HTH domain